MKSAIRLGTVWNHLHPSPVAFRGQKSSNTDASRLGKLKAALHELGVSDVEVSPPPVGLETAYDALMTPPAVAFVAKLVREFNNDVDQMLRRRVMRKLQLDETGELPDFLPETRAVREGSWSVPPLPRRLKCRHVDLGDVSPANTAHFRSALQSTAQGIQTDFDDGHCPTWSNQLLGLYNVHRAVHDHFPDVPPISSAPVLMLRPRAWNMVEHCMLVDGKEVPGPLFDFGFIMFHLAEKLIRTESGPFFYLSKLEGYLEARLWNRIFVWVQRELGIPVGTIKACVLIENILASFEMEEILYELRDHSAGLNCGIWDYSASFVNKFGHRSDFVLPDRNKYVSMDRHFLKSYMDLVIQTCHRRGAYATGGMAAPLLPPGESDAQQRIRDAVKRAKLKEIEAGVDGFMVYDLGLVDDMHRLYREYAPTPNQLHKIPQLSIAKHDLLVMPSGGVTLVGLKHNIGVGVLFIESWLKGKGHYPFRGAVEDSATAEISRSQVWQWIRHQARLEDGDRQLVTRDLVQALTRSFLEDRLQTAPGAGCDYSAPGDRQKLLAAARIFMEIVTKRDFPEFITTYLNLESAYLSTHSM